MTTLELPDTFATLDIEIQGEHIVAPVVNDLTIDEIGEDMDIVAAQMGYWGNVLAAAEEEAAAADAAYRSWRANMGLELAKDPKTAKLASHKLKDLIDGSPQFLGHKRAIARANRNAMMLDRLFQAFAKKANVLQSRGASERAIIERTGLTTTSTQPDNTDVQSERKRRQTRVKDIFSRRGRKTKEGSDTSNQE